MARVTVVVTVMVAVAVMVAVMVRVRLRHGGALLAGRLQHYPVRSGHALQLG